MNSPLPLLPPAIQSGTEHEQWLAGQEPDRQKQNGPSRGGSAGSCFLDRLA
jgi:hypothetical protein